VKMVRIISAILVLLSLGFAQAGHAANPCPRPAAGKEVLPPPDLYSSNGVLNVALNYSTTLSDKGLTLFCFSTPDRIESPTFHVNPGDVINITLTNKVPNAPGAPSGLMSGRGSVCGDRAMTLTSTNMHFHGINASPKCHSDEVIHTLVNSGQTFTYKIKIPANEPPGLYWYHPHVHGIASPAVQGGASGAIIVEGIQNIQPAVAGLPQRLLIIRDQPLPGRFQSPNAPFWDLSINYVPVLFPQYTTAVVKMQAGSKEFWRVANASANSILDLQVMYDGKAQALQIVGLDGVPTGSQDGKRQGTIVTRKDLLIPPAGRVEFIVTAPGATVKDAVVVTNHIDSGLSGDYLPFRRLIAIRTTTAPTKLKHMPAINDAPKAQRFEDLADLKPTAERKLFFSEAFFQTKVIPPGQRPPEAKNMVFFITVDGNAPKVFDPNNPPDITTTRGAVEDWTIENRSDEDHEFHMHQIHFLLLEVNGKPVSKKDRQFYDTYPVQHWDDESPTYPNIKVRMDFRGAVTGDFVYHCHILDHEDLGMMAIIRVLPKGGAAKAKPGQPVQARLAPSGGDTKLAQAGK
jgi:FtsP/CotA-like multicopper oxidase with cupredoxin domain